MEDAAAGDWGLLSPRLCQQLVAPAVSTRSLLAVLALPHLLYAFVWLKPRIWRQTFGKQSVPIFAWTGAAGKALQFISVFLWVWSSQPTGVCPRTPLSVWQVLLAGVLVGYGQALNIGTYRAIGVTGVYYGVRLGRNVPWVTAWPFSHISHPQYVGSAITVWGMLVLLHAAMPHPQALLTAVYWTGLYVMSGIVEDRF
ncbi:hypothetical protein PLESTB_001005900 [Pleodorina starrii]|uniref:phosphatidyl-N-methylethanolamine N-methyltransferase n=1 Tax=Pleodorina starrii TaxID=330485 RepID=A0A9W6F4K8_9CHLO|nr:hypothetical protein PLESTM_001201700 [Pleodorina starrii]GLC55605.1 hypothetical protein PLESTB_001005900 [Pleodorina starrii]GLC65354.1 hypothetical protein PLESTF_000284200 [Pleodorina starrii]